MKPGTAKLLAITVIVGVAAAWTAKGAAERADKSAVAHMTEKMRTVCVGRFLIDLPAGAEVTLGRAFVDGFDIDTEAETEQAFHARLAAREAEIKAKKNELDQKNLEVAQAISMNGFAGKTFMFGRWHTHWFEFGERKDAENVALEGYVHKDGISFTFSSKYYDPALAANLPRLISQLRLVAPNEIPTAAGSCMDRAMFVDPLEASKLERVVMFAGLPGHPDIAIAFSTMAGLKPQRTLLARNAAAAAGDPLYIRAAFTTLREGVRNINGLEGEELAMRVREFNLTTNYSFD